VAPALLDDCIDTLTMKDGRIVHFWSVMPIYQDEMEFKLTHGFDALLDRFIDARVTDLVRPARSSVFAEHNV